MAIVFCPPDPLDRWSHNAWALSTQPTTGVASCAGQSLLNATQLPLERWWSSLVAMLSRRRGPTRAEIASVHARHQSQLHLGHPYFTLALALEKATSDPGFPSRGLWLDFGVFRGLSSNLTSRLAPPGITVDGFDTFSGLPEAWLKRRIRKGGGSLNVYFHKGGVSSQDIEP